MHRWIRAPKELVQNLRAPEEGQVAERPGESGRNRKRVLRADVRALAYVLVEDCQRAGRTRPLPAYASPVKTLHRTPTCNEVTQ